MRFDTLRLHALLLSLFYCSAAAKSSTKRTTVARAAHIESELARRDLAPENSPSKGYAPIEVACPAGLAVRQVPITGQLSAGEQAYQAKRAAVALPAWQRYLENVNLKDFDVATFLKGFTSSHPVIAAAASGGGYRSMLFSGSILNGLDSRNPAAVAAKTGGVLDVLSYLTGLSGGGWMVGSWSLSSGEPFEQLRKVWDLEDSLLAPIPGRFNVFTDAVTSTLAKATAGFPVSIIDIWGRILSYHLISAPDTPTAEPGVATVWDAITYTASWQNGTLPFPIIETTGVVDDQAPSLESVTYEVSPLEFGARHPTLNAFIPTNYLGTPFVDGKLAGPNCTLGFDNAGFLMGAGSDVFLAQGESLEGNPIITLLESDGLSKYVPDPFSDEALTGVVPSPFRGLNPGAYEASAQPDLLLTDSGTTNENIPFQTVLVPERKVDVVLALDASYDTEPGTPYPYRPNGASMYETYQRSRLPGQFIQFPEVPAPGDPVYNKITWFGCDLNTTIIYVPNFPLSNNETGTPTAKVQYTEAEVDSFFTNSFDIITEPQSKGEWPVCLACALVDKQLHREGGKRTEQCKKCFDDYCYAEGHGGHGGSGGHGGAPKPGPSQHHHHHHGASPKPKPKPSKKCSKEKMDKRAEPQMPLQMALPMTMPACPTGLNACPIGDDGFECVDLQSELGACGRCGNDCEAMPGLRSSGSVRCSLGRCQATACQAGFWLDRGRCMSNL